jgi:hypothetical protein
LARPAIDGYGRRRTAGALAPAAVLAGLAGPVPAAAAEPIAIVATEVPLDPADRTREAVGALRYRGGLTLRPPDRRFGGFSDIRVTADGRHLIAVSDRGNWLRARLTYDEGVDARRGPDRETLVYLMSDDNFSSLQRTLLLMFTLEGR